MTLIEDDFEELFHFLQSKKYLKKRIEPEIKEKLRRVHTHIYSLTIWDTALKNISRHGRLFVGEIRSDAIRSLPLCLSGYNKSSAHSVRNIIENGLRLIYYSDNPRQYQKVMLSNKGNTSFRDLFVYCDGHKHISSYLKTLKVLDKLGTTYSESSHYVHAITYRYLDLSKAIKSIDFDPLFFDFYIKIMERTARNVNALLSLYYYTQFRKMDVKLRNVIQKSLGSSYKKFIMNDVVQNSKK